MQAFGYLTASLVAYHSGARFEAQLRGYALALQAFPQERSAVADALIYCDLTTGPTGRHLSFKERIADIFRCYGETDIVTQALRQAMPYVSLAVGRTQRRLHKCEIPVHPIETIQKDQQQAYRTTPNYPD